MKPPGRAGERRRQDLLEVGDEAGSVDRAIKDGGRGEPGHAERGDKRGGVPAAVGRVVGDAGAGQAATLAPHQGGPHATFIKKYAPGRVERGRRGVPRQARQHDVSAVVFGRAYRFF